MLNQLLVLFSVMSLEILEKCFASVFFLFKAVIKQSQAGTVVVYVCVSSTSCCLHHTSALPSPPSAPCLMPVCLCVCVRVFLRVNRVCVSHVRPCGMP